MKVTQTQKKLKVGTKCRGKDGKIIYFAGQVNGFNMFTFSKYNAIDWKSDKRIHAVNYVNFEVID